MRILYVTTIGATMTFFKSLVPQLLKMGHNVDIASNCNGSDVPKLYYELGCKCYQIDWSRNPLDMNNLRAIKQLRKVVEENEYDIVHCHTPIAAACTRLACRRLRKQKKVKVIYTAHGFHFFSGAPLKNWMIFYPIEKLCAHMTDILITINREDYERAQRKLNVRRIEYIPGVGIDTKKFAPAPEDGEIRQRIRSELNIPANAIIILSVGELNQNKNHETVIRAIAEIKQQKQIYYVIAGQGNRKEELENLARELNISEGVKLLGFRSDVHDLYKAADIFVHPSFREGLPVSVMEAMASGLPVVGSDIRGNRDLIDDGKGGCLCDATDYHSFVKAIEGVINCIGSDTDQLLKVNQYAKYNLQKIDNYSDVKVNTRMMEIYDEVISRG